MTSGLFSPLALRSLELANRIVVSPMCQYSAHDGCASDWHLMHLGQFAVSGAGLLFVEMTNVEPRGRISPYCLGLYDDASEQALARVVQFCNDHGATPVGVQLAHAGRKASTLPPWMGRQAVPDGEGGWQPVAPSAITAGGSYRPPAMLTTAEIDALVEAFADATRRADRVGFAAIELHAAHGYLLHQFLSPLSNQRDDEYGGSLENRLRFPLRVFEAAREVWPQDKPMGVRVSAVDWAHGGWDMTQTLTLAKALEVRGCDWLDVSSGGMVAAQAIPTGPGFQVPFAAEVKANTNLRTMAVGLITEAAQAENIISSGAADLVALARGMLYDPRWVWHAAAELGAEIAYPNQYLRCAPALRGDTFAESIPSLHRG